MSKGLLLPRHGTQPTELATDAGIGQAKTEPLSPKKKKLKASERADKIKGLAKKEK